MSHNKTVEVEFTRQAETFLASPTLSASEVTSRVGQALGPGVRRVLDLACGPGVLLPTLSEHAESVVGLDLTRKALTLARQVETNGPVTLVRALAEDLPLLRAASMRWFFAWRCITSCNRPSFSLLRGPCFADAVAWWCWMCWGPRIVQPASVGIGWSVCGTPPIPNFSLELP